MRDTTLKSRKNGTVMKLSKLLAGLIACLMLAPYLLLLAPPASAAATDLPAVKLDLPDYLYTNTVVTITLEVYGSSSAYAGKYLGLFDNQKLIANVEQLDAGTPATIQFAWKAPRLGKHQLRAVLANDRDLTDVVSEDQQERTAIINGYAGNSSMLPFTSGEAPKGDFLFTLGDSKYSGMIEYGSVYTVHYLPELPAGAVVEQARLFASWTWSNWHEKGCEPQILLSLNDQPLIPDRQYSDRKGWGKYDFPSGTWTFDVTKLIAQQEPYTVKLKNTNPENHFAINGIGLLVIYEDSMSEKASLKYWINEGCDIVWSSPISDCTPEEATTWTSFDGVPDPQQITSATLLTLVPSGDKGKNALFFNDGIYYGLWDGKPYADFAYNVQDVTRAIKEGTNDVGCQDRGDYMVPSAAVLMVRMMAGGNGTGDAAAGGTGTGGNGNGSGRGMAGNAPGQGKQATVTVNGNLRQVSGMLLVKVDSGSAAGLMGIAGASGSGGLAQTDYLSGILMAAVILLALIVGFWTERTRLN